MLLRSRLPRTRPISTLAPLQRRHVNTEAYMKEPSQEETFLNILLSCKRGQLSTHSGCGDTTPVASTVVPYSVKNRSQPLQTLTFAVELASPHVANLERTDGILSLVTGHTQPTVKLFTSIGRLPPRAALMAAAVRLSGDDAKRLWSDEFEDHPHVRRGLTAKDVALYRVDELKSAYTMDIGNNMHPIRNTQRLSQTNPDPLYQLDSAPSITLRLNERPKAMRLLCKAFGQEVEDALCISVDRYGIDILALPEGARSAVTEDWVKLRLYYEQEITEETRFFDFVLSLDPQIAKCL